MDVEKREDTRAESSALDGSRGIDRLAHTYMVRAEQLAPGW